jgi:hypothetical protein
LGSSPEHAAEPIAALIAARVADRATAQSPPDSSAGDRADDRIRGEAIARWKHRPGDGTAAQEASAHRRPRLVARRSGERPGSAFPFAERTRDPGLRGPFVHRSKIVPVVQTARADKLLMAVCRHCQGVHWAIVARANVCTGCGNPYAPVMLSPAPPGPARGTAAGPHSHTQAENDSSLVTLGYVTAVIVPIVGFVLGVVVATRPSRVAHHGARIIVLSLVAVAIITVLIMGSQAQDANDQRMAALKQQVCAAANAPVTSLAEFQAKAQALHDAGSLGANC